MSTKRHEVIAAFALVILATTAQAGTVHYPDVGNYTSIESGLTLDGYQLPTFFQAPTLSGNALTFRNLQYGVLGPPSFGFTSADASIGFDGPLTGYRVTLGGGAYLWGGTGLVRATVNGATDSFWAPDVGPWLHSLTIPAASHVEVLFHVEVSAQGASLGVGRVVFQPLFPGDENGDGSVNAADYSTGRNRSWTRAEYNVWKANYGASALAVGEPPGWAFALWLLCWRVVFELHSRKAKSNGIRFHG